MNLCQHLLLRLLIAISVISIAVQSLECIQCAPNTAWYSEQEEERRIEACRQGLVAPTECSNASHTHCIVNWYRTGGSSEKMVMKRHCGVESDVTGCTLYNSKISRKVRRHLLSRDDSQDRRESVSSFVEVCSTSCPIGDCVNSSNLRGALLFPIVFSIIYVIYSNLN
ncbi:hypothetical protein B9Z55_001088 [Caenorhabditis nigoni]|uniref:RING-CH-type domain-containing protein n=1 Tax=Caenorhabditis nigoni TaxID=1611254 RepID=A0A2G5VE16_9PELO|nr:hypothetical protein B9Z55_001088 [Caenorhabditis nigoni]